MGRVYLSQRASLRRPQGRVALRLRATAVVVFSLAGSLAAAAADPCTISPMPGPTVNVRDTGAKGDGRTNDTAALQKAIDAVADKEGTVVVPDGVYMLNVVGDNRVMLKSRMALKLSPG